MVQDKLRAGLELDVKDGLMTQESMDELLEQNKLFEARRKEIEDHYQLKVVGMAGGKLYVGDDLHAVFEQVQKQMPGRLVYFETVGFDLKGVE